MAQCAFASAASALGIIAQISTTDGGGISYGTTAVLNGTADGHAGDGDARVHAEHGQRERHDGMDGREPGPPSFTSISLPCRLVSASAFYVARRAAA